MIDIEKMQKCVAFFDGRPDEWRAYEGEGRCSKCERNRHSVCVDDMLDGPHCCVATIHAPGKEAVAAKLAGMIAWQIELFASPKSARAVLVALRAAEKMASAVEAYNAAEDKPRVDRSDAEICTWGAMVDAVDAFRKVMRGEGA